MGCQGEIYVIYGATVEAKVAWEAGVEKNPVVYSVNGHTLCDDEDFMGYQEEPDDEPFTTSDGKPVPEGCPKIEFFNGVPTNFYGAADLSKVELTFVVLAHSSEYGHGNMGARHFAEGFGRKVGAVGKALVGFPVCNESYINHASPCPPMDDIKALAPKLIAEIKEKLGLDVSPSDLRLHLHFDSLNGW